MGVKAKPVAPIYEPEVPARAIFFAATHRRRQVWVGYPTVQAILANRIAPWPIWAQSLFYLAAGLVWLLPLRPLLVWMNKQ